MCSHKKETFAGFHAFKISLSRQQFKVVSIFNYIVRHISQNTVWKGFINRWVIEN